MKQKQQNKWDIRNPIIKHMIKVQMGHNQIFIIIQKLNKYMRKILSFCPLATRKTCINSLNSLTFKPVYYARFSKRNQPNNKQSTQPISGWNQNEPKPDSQQGDKENMNGKEPRNNSKIRGPKKLLNMIKSGNINILPFYINHMIKNTRNPSLPGLYVQQPLKIIKPKQQKQSQMESPQKTNQTSNKPHEKSPQTHMIYDFVIKSSSGYSKDLMKKYKIIQSLKYSSKRTQAKNFSYFRLLTQNILKYKLTDSDKKSIVLRLTIYGIIAAIFLINFIIQNSEPVADPKSLLDKYSYFSDSDIQSKIDQIKEIRVKTNKFNDYQMIVVLKQQKQLNLFQKILDSIGFSIQKNKTLIFNTQNPNLILDGLEKAQQNKQELDLIKIKPLVKPYSPYDAFWDTLMLATPFIGIAITYWIFNKVNPDSMMKRITSNKKSMKIESTKDIKVRFKDVAGMENAKKQITQFVDFLKNSDKFVEMGAKIPKGALLTGPPGTGKTMLAKACAGQAGTSFFYVSGSQFVEMFVGLGASRVRELFAKARQQAPSIIFIDEIDAIGKKRETSRNQQKDSTLNQMLVEMDGFSTSETVIVLAATNRKDILDSALTRPGRFDRMVEITLPELKARQEIFMVHLTPLKINPNRPLNQIAQRLAQLTPGFSGADIANLCNEAAIIATRKKRQFIEDADFQEASERIVAGYVKKGLSNEKTKRRVAYHEAGHAVCGWYLRGGDPLVKLTIIPRSKGALGYAQYLPKTAYIRTKSQLIDQIAIMLGGTTSEQIFLGGMSSGNSDDLQKVYSTARRMVTQFGMGARTYNMTLDEQTYVKKESEKLCNIMDEEMLAIVNEATERAKNIITVKREIVQNLTKQLLDKETLNNQDILRIMGERPAFN